MSKKRMSPKQEKQLSQKHVRELTDDDYVDRTEHMEFCDSDILAPAGVSAKTSDQESQDYNTSKTLGQREEEAEQEAQRLLEDLSDEDLAQTAVRYGLKPTSFSRDALIRTLTEYQ